MKKPRAFLVHWKKEELTSKVKLLREVGFTVATEHEDGAKAGANIKAKRPSVIVIYLSRLPSHGREIAEYFAQTKSTRSIPIVFVDGEPEKIANVRQKVPTGIFTTENKLHKVLQTIHYSL